jgi:CDP-glucose 4,6-dehydratase
LNPGFWRSKNVFVTGHTGFKGSWLSQMLVMLDANVSGFALKPETNPSHFDLLEMKIDHHLGDIRDGDAIADALRKAQPEIVFHLAAQPLVLRSYAEPKYTYETNVMGTLHLLEAVRNTPSVKVVIVVTSDKCYENREDRRAYRENDSMGGYDPYSSSKGCAEILTASYRQSFLHPNVLVASVRAGNVLGGGDWSKDRLIPDFARAYQAKKKVVLRNLSAIRPWQHVLDPLSGYLQLGEELMKGKKEFAKGWNFGPDLESCWTVEQIVKKVKQHWSGFDYDMTQAERHEAKLLMLDSTQAREELGWQPALKIEKTLAWTLQWYEQFQNSGEIITRAQISEYLET